MNVGGVYNYITKVNKKKIV